MFDDMKANLKDWTDEEEISRYLTALLHKEAFDHAGLIYGMGHAVYSLSDPRAQIFRGFVKRLSAEKGYEKEFALYTAVERLAPQIIAAERKIYKGVSPNVDFFSGFAYSKLQAAARSCVLPTKTSASIRFMSRWMSVSDFHCTPCSKKAARGLTERAGRSMWQYANLELRL